MKKEYESYPSATKIPPNGIPQGITRVEVIGTDGSLFYFDGRYAISIQDDGKTIKLFEEN